MLLPLFSLPTVPPPPSSPPPLFHPTALGESAADSLAVNHPYASMGHLSHMPGHLYIRTGRWHDAVTSNQAALQADDAIAKR